MSTTVPTLLAQAGNAPNSGGGSTLMVWALALIGLAAMLFLIEIFIPSGGLIGIISGLSLVTGIILLFWHNQIWGVIGAILSLLALPFLLGFALKMWPETPIGRLLMLNAPASNADPAAADHPSKGATATGGVSVQVGQQGRAVTEMRPVGTCVFDRRREECLATGGLINSGTTVEIVAIDGKQIKVRPVQQ